MNKYFIFILLFSINSFAENNCERVVNRYMQERGYGTFADPATNHKNSENEPDVKIEFNEQSKKGKYILGTDPNNIIEVRYSAEGITGITVTTNKNQHGHETVHTNMTLIQFSRSCEPIYVKKIQVNGWLYPQNLTPGSATTLYDISPKFCGVKFPIVNFNSRRGEHLVAGSRYSNFFLNTTYASSLLGYKKEWLENLHKEECPKYYSEDFLEDKESFSSYRKRTSEQN